jgi:catechol 2,3-dioxygenase-like lactoylglutathione lyase family enzyme
VPVEKPYPTTRSLHHIALGSADPARLAAFYEAALGLPVVRTNLSPDGSVRSVWLRLGDGVLMVERALTSPDGAISPAPEGANPLPIEKRGGEPGAVLPGWFLLAVSVEQSERAEIEAEVKKLCGTHTHSTEFTSYFTDPEGHRFAVSAYSL